MSLRDTRDCIPSGGLAPCDICSDAIRVQAEREAAREEDNKKTGEPKRRNLPPVAGVIVCLCEHDKGARRGCAAFRHRGAGQPR